MVLAKKSGVLISSHSSYKKRMQCVGSPNASSKMKVEQVMRKEIRFVHVVYSRAASPTPLFDNAGQESEPTKIWILDCQ